MGVSVLAQEGATSTGSRLLDRPPFDRLILKGASGRKPLDVMPLELPQRPLTAIPTEGRLQVRLMDRPGEAYELAWTDVASVRVYEELLLDEAKRLSKAGQFDEAFDYFGLLSARYASVPGLSEAISEFLRGNALALYRAGEADRALAVLVTLQKHNPNFSGLANAVQTVAGEIIQRYLRDGNYEAARGVLDLWRRQFPELATAAANEWQSRFQAAAARQLEEGQRLIAQKDYIGARKSVARATAIWPAHEGAAALQAQIKREFPFITVGVFEAAPRNAVRRIDSWAALRTSRLVQRLLVELVDFGAEGGIYQSPCGELELDPTGRELRFNLLPSENASPVPTRLTPDAVSRFALSLAKPESPFYRPDFAALLSGVALDGNVIQLQFVRPHVRPEAFLQLPPPIDAPGETDSQISPYIIRDYSAGQVVFSANQPTSGDAHLLHAVVEETMPDGEGAVKALVAGEIDVLDRVPPWFVETLRERDDVRVETYRLPTVHVLIPNVDRPLLARREFRRALCFGIDRKWIVERMLLGGRQQNGFDVLSGPFPTGLALSDPIRYAYNNQIAPRPFEPRLAAILATIAWANVQNPSEDEAQETTAELPELVLAHPSDPVAQTVCALIEAQLERAGIPIRLVEFSADDLLEGRIEYDLRYAELAVWEPVYDARIVSTPGLQAGNLPAPYLAAALARLDEATNWTDVRTRLNELHEFAHHELPVIPLWQTVNHFAYRTSIGGVGQSPITLYQNIDRWQASSGSGDVAGLDRSR